MSKEISLKMLPKKEREEVLKKRKRISRNDETVIFDAMIYLLVKVGYNVKIKRSKKTTQTIKMFLPDHLVKDGRSITSYEIAGYSELLLKELNHKSFPREEVNKKSTNLWVA